MDMIAFRATFHGRLVGSIGITYRIFATVDAKNLEDARIKLSDRYEHISGLVWAYDEPEGS